MKELHVLNFEDKLLRKCQIIVRHILYVFHFFLPFTMRSVYVFEFPKAVHFTCSWLRPELSSVAWSTGA